MPQFAKLGLVHAQGILIKDNFNLSHCQLL